jgi:hypothetical protein
MSATYKDRRDIKLTVNDKRSYSNDRKLQKKLQSIKYGESYDSKSEIQTH